jgi:hypothetical protein
MVKGLIQKIFKPDEVQLLLKTLDVEIAKIENLSNLELSMALDLIKGELRQTIISNSATIEKKISQNDISSLALAYTSIKNLAGAYLQSGRYHVYRGVLSMQGQALKSLFAYSSNKLIDLRTLTGEQVAEQLRMLDDDIRGVG